MKILIVFLEFFIFYLYINFILKKKMNIYLKTIIKV